MHHVDLLVGEHDIEEIGKGGTRPAHRVSTKYGTSVTILPMEKWDAGQAVVLPH